MRGGPTNPFLLFATLLAAVLLSGCADARSTENFVPPKTGESRGVGGSAEGRDPGAGAGEGNSVDEGVLPSYRSSVSTVRPPLRRRMTGVSHDPSSCPVDLADLRLLQVSHVGFDGRHHTGELVVGAQHARAVVSIFERLYDARFPIRRMRLVDEYGGDDDRSMAANNTSAYNCRRVAGQEAWSDHAYGAAIDINPVQNPYVTDQGILPPGGRRFAGIDRSSGTEVAPGVITRGDVVVRAFRSHGWSWGGDWNQPDFQHFTAR
jgi:poly-gamma-glutamate synthesis protein (capsule biosynthesis protein)